MTKKRAPQEHLLTREFLQEFLVKELRAFEKRLERRMDDKFELQTASLKEYVDNRFEAMDKRFDEMDRRFDRLEKKLDVNTTGLVELIERRITKLEVN